MDGGTPPLGYRPDGRTLAIAEDHAALIREIYRRYLATGNVRQVAEQLAVESIGTPIRTTITGRDFGGVPFSRGQLYKILGNPIYVGDIAHQGKLHKGLHPPVIERDSWERVQLLMTEHVRGEKQTYMPNRSLLAGLIIDDKREPLVATHATKKQIRYRYYVSRALQHDPGAGKAGMRIPAREIEAAVGQAIADAFSNPLALHDKAGIAIEPDELLATIQRAKQLGADFRSRSDSPVRRLTTQVRIFPREVQIELSTRALVEVLQLEVNDAMVPATMLASSVRLTRTGRAERKDSQSCGPALRMGQTTGTARLARLSTLQFDSLS